MATVLTGVTTPSALTYTPMSPFFATAVETRKGGGEAAVLAVFARPLDWRWNKKKPMPASTRTKMTTVRPQRRDFSVPSAADGFTDCSRFSIWVDWSGTFNCAVCYLEG